MGEVAVPRATTRTPSALRSWVAAHPVVVFVGLAYLVSWAYWIPLALGDRTVESGVGWPTQLPGLAGPAVSAIVVTALTAGTAGLADLWHRLTRWRVGWWWLSVVAILAAGAVGLAIVAGPWDTAALTRYPGVGASLGPAATVVLVLLINGFGEETGWRGFLADRLLERHGLTASALLVALAWAPWHLPLFFLQSSFAGFTAAGIVGWALGLTAGSVVLTWLYGGSSHSILLVAVWHTAFNFTSATPAGGGTVAAITSTVVMVVAAAVLARAWRRGHTEAVRAR